MELQYCINYLLTLTQHEVFQTFSERLSRFGITPGQYGVLNCLWQRESCTPKEIVQTLQLDSSTVSGVLDRMQKGGLIDRVIDPADRRSVQVIATELGNSIRDEVLQTIADLNEEILGDFSQEDRATLISCLQQIGKVNLP